MKKTATILTVFFVVLALGVGSLQAQIIEIKITAEIAYIDDLDGLLNGQLGVGSIISGSYIYDSATADSRPLDETYGRYLHYSPPYGISLSGGGFTFQTDPDNVEFLVAIANGSIGIEDVYLLRSYNNLPLYDNVSVGHISWQLDDSTGTALSSDALPTTPPVLEDWDDDWGIRITGGIPDEEGKFIERFIISAFVTSVELVPYQPKTYYVNATDGSDDNDGLTAETAFATIQKAIDSSFNGDTVIVAGGTYTGPGNRDIDFLGKAITVRSESGPENCIIDCQGTWQEPHRGFYFHRGEDANSILAGFAITKSLGWDGAAIYCKGSSPMITRCTISGNRSEGGTGGILCEESDGMISNCTISNNIGSGIYCVHSSLKITDCTITGNKHGYGGGIFAWDCNLTIANCTISENTSSGIIWDQCIGTISNCMITENRGDFGGGIDCGLGELTISHCTISGNVGSEGSGIFCGGSSPTITSCTISWNSGWIGGGIGCDGGGNPAITGCVIRGNTAEYGGGVFCSRSNPTITNCIIDRNTAKGYDLSGEHAWGGGLCCWESSPTITNCIINDNSAGGNGGGIYCRDSSSVVANCTFAGNSSTNGNALAFDSYVQQHPSNIHITNCILTDGGNEIWNNDNSTITITYSDVQGGWTGQGNIDADPCFVEPGYWDVNDTPDDANDDFWVEGDYHLLPNSPCIDAGDPKYIAEPNETDLDGNPRVRGDAIDMGPYETIMHEARLLILPRVINRKSSKPRIMAWLRLPQGITKNQIDRDEPLILYPGGIKAIRQFVIQNRRRGPASIFAVFDKAELMDAIPAKGRVQLQVLGRLRQPGQYFSGSDTIRIIPRPSKPQPQRKTDCFKASKIKPRGLELKKLPALFCD